LAAFGDSVFQISRQEIETEMRHNHVRHDAIAVLDRTPPLDAVLGDIRNAA
jgi:hypothetical protein